MILEEYLLKKKLDYFISKNTSINNACRIENIKSL